MTPASRSVEQRLTAFLGNEDRADIPNIIHSSEGARQYGYRAALVGGATVFGWATPAILEALGAGWLDHGWAEVAFRRPTYPGDPLEVRVTPEAGGGWSFRMTKDAGDAVSGSVGLGDAPWLPELSVPVRRRAEDRPTRLPRLTLGVAPVGEDLRPLAVAVPAAEMREYATLKQRSTDERFIGERPLVHPSWLVALMIRLLHHSYDYGPAIHAGSRVQHLAPVVSGQTLTVAGRFLEAYERKGHHYGVIDGVVIGEDGRELTRIRHTTVFEVARRGAADV